MQIVNQTVRKIKEKRTRRQQPTDNRKIIASLRRNLQSPNKMSFPKALAWKSHTIVELGLGEDCKQYAQLPLRVHALDQAINKVGLKVIQLRHRVILF